MTISDMRVSRWALDCAIFAFACEHPQLGADQDVAANMCGSASRLLVEFCREHGIDATVVEGFAEFPIDGDEPVEQGHAVVRVGDLIVDWTARQFYPGAPVPLIVPYADWRAGWRRVEASPSTRIRRGSSPSQVGVRR